MNVLRILFVLSIATSPSFATTERCGEELSAEEKAERQETSLQAMIWAELPNAEARRQTLRSWVAKDQLEVVNLLGKLRVESDRGNIWYPSFAPEGASPEVYSAAMIGLLGEIAADGK